METELCAIEYNFNWYEEETNWCQKSQKRTLNSWCCVKNNILTKGPFKLSSTLFESELTKLSKGVKKCQNKQVLEAKVATDWKAGQKKETLKNVWLICVMNKLIKWNLERDLKLIEEVPKRLYTDEVTVKFMWYSPQLCQWDVKNNQFPAQPLLYKETHVVTLPLKYWHSNLTS